MSDNLAVLITVHNRKAKTLACLENLYLQKIRFNVYLVDDGSTDGTASAIEEKFPQVKIIRGDGSLFWNRGMLLAWQTAAKEKDWDFYLWLNDDVELLPNAIENLLNTSEQFKNKSIVVGTCCSKENENNLTYGGYLSLIIYKIKPILAEKEPLECLWFGGNIVLVPKYVYEKLGMLDKAFRHAGGDFDYGLRARKLKIRSYVAIGILGKCSIGNHKEIPCYDSNNSFYKRLNFFLKYPAISLRTNMILGIRYKCIFSMFVYYLSRWFHCFFPRLYRKLRGKK